MSPLTLFLIATAFVAAFQYVRRMRPAGRPLLAAYLIFVTVLIAVFASLFFFFSYFIVAWGYEDRLAEPAWAFALVTACALPAFLLARWQLLKPPKAPPPI